MIDRTEAEEHLRVIRSLMEKATVYRAISAEAAAVGGVLAVAASFAFGNWLNRSADSYPHTQSPVHLLIPTWLAVLVLTAIANLYFLRRDAARRNEPFFSSGMRLAIRSLAPGFLAAGIGTYYICFYQLDRGYPFIVSLWCACYGLALLSTQTFAPRSLAILGWCFLGTTFFTTENALMLSGLAFYQIPAGHDYKVWLPWNSIFEFQRMMALTFGLFHLVYAACTWPRGSSTK
jgi:hypothetical protein